jgi:hypothetical protein
MNKVVIVSVCKSNGKTSAIIGISAALNKKIAYLKPFGERMVYQENRLWHYDTALVREIFRSVRISQSFKWLICAGFL